METSPWIGWSKSSPSLNTKNTGILSMCYVFRCLEIKLANYVSRVGVTKAEIEKWCIPSTYKLDLAKKKLDSMSVAEYSVEFHTLSSRANMDAPE